VSVFEINLGYSKNKAQVICWQISAVRYAAHMLPDTKQAGMMVYAE
jgi:hypothetical protein